MKPWLRMRVLSPKMLAHLAPELALSQKRYEATVRFVVAMTIVIICSMALQIPMLALSLLIVFFVGQENTTLTRLTGLVIVAGSSISIALALLLLKFSMGAPLLRMAGSCVIAFCGVYFMRISKVGIVGFAAALAAVYVQSLIDIYDSPEQLTRFVLWVWVAINYPALVSILVSETVYPSQPAKLLKCEMIRQMKLVRAQLMARIDGTPATSFSPHVVADDLMRLHRQFEYARQSDANVRLHQERHLRRLLAIDRLYVATTNLNLVPQIPLNEAQIEVLQILNEDIRALHKAIADDLPYFGRKKNANIVPFDPRVAAAVLEVSHALDNARDSEEGQIGPIEIAQSYLLRPDAWSNPAYAKFSLRTVLVTMLGYVLYTCIQWPGIHTVMLTCIIVAMPSIGTATHKGINRVIGCAFGSLVALFFTVFIVPALDGIVGLLLVTIPVITFGAWIAAGSTRIAYAGHQFVFAFSLAEFGLFGPTTDVTEIRDRMFGILLGVAISILAAHLVYREKEEDSWTHGFHELCNKLVGMLRTAAVSGHDATFSVLRQRGLHLLCHCREVMVGVYFESMGSSKGSLNFHKFLLALSKAQDLFFSLSLLHSLASKKGNPALSRDISDRASDVLDQLGKDLEAMTLPTESAGASETKNVTSANDALVMNQYTESGISSLVSAIQKQTSGLIRTATEVKA